MSKRLPLVALPLLLPSFVFAQTAVENLIGAITDLFLTIIPIMMGLAVLAFFWGLVKFINHADDEKAVAEGKMLMIWGMIALFVMVALWGIVGYIQEQFGLDSASALPDLPSMPNRIP